MPDTVEPTPLADTEVHDLWSDEVQTTFRIFVGHCGERPRATLFVTDANGLFGMAVDTIRLMQLPALLPSMLVVGIGYPDAGPIADTVAVRARDLTPTHSRLHEGSGHADDFLRFLDTELRGWLEPRVPSCLETTVYFGHSLGGLFGAHALLQDRPAFDGFIISSPSLWWDRYVVLERESLRAADHDDLPARVYLGIGALETDAGRRVEAANLPPDHPAKPPAIHLDMVGDVVRLAETLRTRRYPNLDLRTAIHPDEFHATVAPLVLSHGLRHVFRTGDA